MKYFKFVLLFFFIVNIFFGNANELKEGYWKGELKLEENNTLNFVFFINKKQRITIQNAQERILLKEAIPKNDSLFLSFLSFPNYLIFKVKSKKSIEGYFVSIDRKSNRRIALNGQYFGDKEPKYSDKKENKLNGNWQVSFDPETKNKFPAIGKFKQNGNRLTGTFLTETGDFRFLSGSFKNNKLTLSSFDGAHVFLFTATLKNDTLKGDFLSGSHYKTNWIGFKNKKFELENPDSLTYMVKDLFTFNFKTTAGEDYKYPNKDLENKVVIIQILGTWCPNCLDETMFYKELYEEYNNLGLEIIGVAYESPYSFIERVKRINRFTENKKIAYPILVGGHASKKESSKDFNMLNEITSFPTSIFINRHGEVIKIHTGFNGPGTGEIYTDYKNKTKILIESLLNK
jgi:thiol-disulfide isomerase/thioredoxin